MNTFDTVSHAAIGVPVSPSDPVGEDELSQPVGKIGRRLVLLSTASVIALAMIALPASIDPDTHLPRLATALADSDNGHGGGDDSGGNGQGGGDDSGDDSSDDSSDDDHGNGQGADDGPGDDQGRGNGSDDADGDETGDRDRDRDRDGDQDQDRDRDRDRDQDRDAFGAAPDSPMQARERTRARNGFTAGEGFPAENPEDVPDIGDLSPVSPDAEPDLVGDWTGTNP